MGCDLSLQLQAVVFKYLFLKRQQTLVALQYAIKLKNTQRDYPRNLKILLHSRTEFFAYAKDPAEISVFLRRSAKPTNPRPTINMAYVSGSGIGLTLMFPA